jgi:hypothetical protein
VGGGFFCAFEKGGLGRSSSLAFADGCLATRIQKGNLGQRFLLKIKGNVII